MAGQVYKKERVKGPYDAIVIGSGIGGLCAAALLAKENKSVLVLEKHYVAGGFTHTFKRKEYEWDVGVHYIGEVHRRNSILRRLFDDITDGELKWSQMPDLYDRVFIEDDEYHLMSGVKNFRDQMITYFPKEESAIKKYIDLVFTSAKSAQSFFGEKALPPWIGSLARPLMSRKFLELAKRSTWDVISSLTRDPKLIGVLTAQWGDYGLTPRKSSFAIHAMVAKHYFEGGNYPVGGSAQIATTIAPVIEKAGGHILLKAGVDKVILEGDRAIGVRLDNGDEIRAPIVISDAGVPNTFARLLDAEKAESLGLLKKLAMVYPSLSHVCLYMGFKENAEALGLGQANYWIYPGYDHDYNIRHYVEDPDNPLPVTYISFPSAKDPDWDRRHPNTATMEIIGFAPYNWFQNWERSPWKRRGDDYESFKEDLSNRLLNKMYEYLPHLKGKLDYSEMSTPLSTRHFCNYERGEIYGIEHTPQRFQQSWLRPHTPVKNLYLTGQDIVSDGIGGAMMGGALTASAVMRRNLIKDVVKRT